MKKLPRRRKSRKPAKSPPQFTISAEDAAKYNAREETKVFSFSFPAQPRGGRPRTTRTEMLLARVRRLRAQKKPLVPLAAEFWPHLSAAQARNRLAVFISKHKHEI